MRHLPSPSHPLSSLLCVIVMTFGATACGQGLGEPLSQAREGGRGMLEQTNEWIGGDAMAQRRQKCDEEGGQWAERLIVSSCNQGEALIESELGQWRVECIEQEGMTAEYQCLHEDGQGSVYFNDGPSVPPEMQKISGLIDGKVDQQRYNGLFWQAGVSHDLCYHHNPATLGETKEVCDRRFLADLAAVCAYPPHQDIEWFRKDVCRNLAAGMYVAVDKFGQESFDALNVVAKVPAYTPLSETFGLTEDPIDEDLEEKIKKAQSWSP